MVRRSSLVIALIALLAVGMAPASAAPATPTGFTLSGATTTSLTWTWNASAGATKYRLWYGTNANGSSAKKLEVTGSPASISGLKANTTYYVDIAALDAAGKPSTYTSRQQVKTLAAAGGPPSTPAGFAVTPAITSATATWTPSAGAAKYRLWYGTNANGSGAKKLEVTGSPATIPGLKANTTYHVDIAALGSDGKLSPYTSRQPFKTLTAAGGPPPTPTGFAVTPAITSATATWNASAGATRYRLWYGTNANGSGATKLEVTGSPATIPGLKANTTYHVDIAAIGSDGKLSPYTTRTAFTTKPTVRGPEIEVASYNVAANRNLSGVPAWDTRKQAVWDGINAHAPDVIGLQEASQNVISGADYRYYDDVVAGLPGYVLTDRSAYNCANDRSPTHAGSNPAVRCHSDQQVDQGASSGTRIAYNSATMTLISSGSKLLSDLAETQGPNGGTYTDKYMAWAVLEKIGTGERIFFANTHLIDGDSAAQRAKRVTQAQRLRAFVTELNTGGLPVVVVGDFNAYRYNGRFQPILDMTAAGYVDPLGQVENSARPGPKAQAGLRRLGRTNCDSFTGYRSVLPLDTNPINGEKDCWGGYTAAHAVTHNGNNIDYIFTRGAVKAVEWETVINMDNNGNIIGTLGSDHHLLRAVLEIEP